MFTVYAIKSKIKSYIYVGFTNNLKRRIEQHNRGLSRTTKPYRPFTIIYTKKYLTRIEARRVEKRLKSGFGKEFLKNL